MLIKDSYIKLQERFLTPLVYDDKGVKISENLKIAGIINVEGKLPGTPVLFLNIYGCNLNCIYRNAIGELTMCDNNVLAKRTPVEMTIPTLFDYLSYNLYDGVDHLYIRAGEPYQQSESLRLLLGLIRTKFPFLHITIETNGTVEPNVELTEFVNLISIKCHLNDMTPTFNKQLELDVEYDKKLETYQNATRKKIERIQSIIDSCYGITDPSNKIYKSRICDFELKFYIDNKVQPYDVLYLYQNRLDGLKNEDIFLIPFYDDMESINFNNYIVNNVTNFKWRFSYRNKYEEYYRSESF